MNSSFIIAITVSTNYDDVLSHALEANHTFFKHWYIITDESDKATIELCSRYSNVEVLFFVFKTEQSNFNKGGAIYYAQTLAHERFKDEWILILDSDICLPKDFNETISNVTLDENTLYGITRKLYDPNDMTSYKLDTRWKNSNLVIGFFQLYKYRYLYPNFSQSCSDVDCVFSNKFEKKEWLNIIADHLGEAFKNWNGRITKRLDKFPSLS